MSISVVDPVGPAITWTKRVLFQPFNFLKWLALGFCAWLAYLGSGGGSFNFRLPGNSKGSGFDEVRAWVQAHMELVITLAVILVVLGIILGLVMTWLSSRGKFMFLDNLARDRAEIREPWNRFREQGNSLFFFRLAFGLVGFCLMLVLGGFVLLMLWGSIAARTLLPMGIVGIGLGAFLFLAWIVVLICVSLALEDFVIPLMYLRGCRVMAAWREFRALLAPNVGTFVLYVLFKIVIGFAIGIIACLATCLTCCLAALPYVGTVILLPLFVFIRSYPLYFLAQFGPDYRLLPDPEALAGAAA